MGSPIPASTWANRPPNTRRVGEILGESGRQLLPERHQGERIVAWDSSARGAKGTAHHP